MGVLGSHSGGNGTERPGVALMEIRNKKLQYFIALGWRLALGEGISIFYFDRLRLCTNIVEVD